MWQRALLTATQAVEERRYARNPDSAFASLNLFNTFVLKTLDLKSTSQAKDANAALLTLEQATTEYHQLEIPSDLIPYTIPAGAAVASLFKLMVFDASVSFNFCATLLAQAKIMMMENHATGVFSTGPLFVYQVLAQLDVPGDAQLVKILHWITLAATLVIGSLEALVATDLQRAAGLMAEVYMLLSHTASDIEAVRIGSNMHLSSLNDRRGSSLSTINPYLQATVLESQKQAVVNNALLS
jgi:hypothetical protein